jgi:predicted dehydrogenase
MDKVRIGIVGIGNMGTIHAINLYEGKVEKAELTAICDIKKERCEWADEYFKGEVQTFTSFEDLIAANCVDALIIATPHYLHPTLGIKTLQANLHLLSEKPAGVYTKAVEELNKVASESDKVFTIMYNQRTNPIYQKAKELIDSGELGELIRVNWVITNWFRSQQYYNSGGWRATWEGEGGGVLLNQCPHQIDLIQWLCGLPERVRGFCHYGKYHDIEVEDDVTAYFEYANGATGTFITSTGEAPGTNRLEISGENGKLVVEKGSITFYRNRVSVFEHSKTTTEGFKAPENWECKIPVKGELTEHVGIMQEFVNAILTGSDQLSPGVEGIRGLSLSNAIHLSSWKDNWVNLPINGDEFYEYLQEKITNSTIKKEVNDVVLDVKGSH